MNRNVALRFEVVALVMLLCQQSLVLAERGDRVTTDNTLVVDDNNVGNAKQSNAEQVLSVEHANKLETEQHLALLNQHAKSTCAWWDGPCFARESLAAAKRAAEWTKQQAIEKAQWAKQQATEQGKRAQAWATKQATKTGNEAGEWFQNQNAEAIAKGKEAAAWAKSQGEEAAAWATSQAIAKRNEAAAWATRQALANVNKTKHTVGDWLQNAGNQLKQN